MSLEPILDAVDAPALAVGADGEIRAANAAAAEATGLARLAGRHLDEVLAPVGENADEADRPSAWLGALVGRRRATLHDAEGQHRSVDVHVAPLATGEAESLVVLSSTVAVTQHQERDQERDRTLRQLTEAEALAGLGSWEWDTVTNEVRWSDQFCRLIGVDPAETEPSYDGYMAAVHPEDRDQLLADIQAAFDSDEAFTTEHRIVRPDGEVRHVRGRAAVVRDDEGNPLRMLGAQIDVTEQHELQRRKDEFVSVVSHELRTPLTSISGALGLLVSGSVGELPAQAQRMIDIAASNADRLVRLINDILDLERIQSGKADMVREDLDVDRVVADAVATMEGAAAEAGVRLETDVQAPGRLVGDADRLQQVLINLISNALEYSPEGEAVTVAARREDADVVLAVTDRGRGMPPEDAARVFERFEQVDASDAREKGGTGLGLTVCKSIVDEHGGEIWAESQEGRGTSVVVRLPAGPLLAEAGPADAPLMLVCDDEADARAIARATLEAGGYRVVTARDGEEALRRAGTDRPDAVVLDLAMPGRDGWQVAAQLQQEEATADIPVVILSALAAEATGAAANIADWVDKAMIDADLVGAVERALGQAGGDAQSARLLLVEDDPGLAGVLAEAFRRHGLAVWVARDGREAERLCGNVEPHALVLDLLLPERDGFAMVESMRSQDRLRHTPLVVYTALELDPEQRAELRLGPTEYYTKGRVSPQQIQQRVLELLRGVAPGAPARVEGEGGA